MTTFRPIAIVGQACVLPDAASPSALWSIVVEKRNVVTDVPRGRFRIDPALVAGTPSSCVDRTYSTRGGYVRAAASHDDGLDPLFHWVEECGRGALVDAGFDAPLKGVRAGAVVGNLSFPTEA